MSVTSDLRSRQSLLQRLIEGSTAEARRDYKFSAILLAIMITSLSLVLLSVGAVPINAIPWDVLLLLDGGWRIFNGQIPHTDYYNPIGPFTYSLVALGMKLTHPSASSIAYGNVILLVILTPWAWSIARSRLSAATASVFAGFMGFLLIAPRALGFDAGWTTYAMLYNRQGFVLLSMLLLELFIAPRPSVKHKFWASGLTSGILLALLFWCKISYFSIGAIAVLLHPILFRPSRRWFISCVGSFLLVCLSGQILFNINLASYLSDISFAGRSQYVPNRIVLLMDTIRLSFLQACLVFAPLLISSIYLLRNKYKNAVIFERIRIWTIPLLLLLAGLLLCDRKLLLTYPIGVGLIHASLIFIFLLFSSIYLFKNKDKNSEVVREVRIWAITLFVVLAGFLLSIGNAQNGQDIPLFLTAGIIIFEHFRREVGISERFIKGISKMTFLLVILSIVLFLLGSIFLKDVRSLAYAVAWHKFNLPSISESQRFQSETLHDFVIPETTEATTVYWKARNVTQNINEGLALLRKHISKDSRIFSIAYTNPFPFALELPSPKGVALWWDKGLSFNQEFFPDAEKVFSDTDMVMLPDVVNGRDPGCCIETPDLMKELYGDYLETHFVEKDRSKIWTLLVRR